MKLDDRLDSAAERQTLRDAIASLRAGCRNDAAPCRARCPRPQDRHCSPECPEAARALSSEPDREPLEPAVTPLVYQLRKLRVFQPFWSCQGHDGSDGKPWKSPRVWFYSGDVVHARVLADCLHALRGSGTIACRWQVALTYCEPQNSGAAFALEPAAAETASLAELQSDVRRIAAALPAVIEEQLRRIEDGIGA